MSAGAGAVAAAAAAAAQAIRASGAIVSVEPNEFLRLVDREEQPLIVHAQGGVFSTKHQYLMSHRGLIFCTKSPLPLALSRGCEMIEAKKIWVP